MGPRPRSRRLLAVLASVFLSPGASLAAPSIDPPEFEQCDGSFTTGTTRKPNPQVQTRMRDATLGLKIGEQQPDRYIAQKMLLRLNNNYQIRNRCGAGDPTWIFSKLEPDLDAGTGGGLWGSYFNTIDFTGTPKLTRIDGPISFDVGTSSVVSSVDADTFSIRWVGTIEADASGTYRFGGDHDDRLEILIDGQSLYNQQVDGTYNDQFGVSTTLVVGARYPIEVRYAENTGAAKFTLKWTHPVRAPVSPGEVIPFSVLKPTPDIELGRCTYAAGGCGAATALASTPLPPIMLAACPVNSQTAPLPASGNVTFSAAGMSVGRFGNTINFNGSNERIVIADSPWAEMPADYTLSAWVRPDVIGSQMRVISQQNGTRFWGLHVDAGGGVGRFDSRDAVVNEARGSMSAGAWHYIAVVRSNGLGYRYFIDGRLVGTGAASFAQPFSIVTNTNVNAPVFVASFGGGSEFFDGDIDELRVIPYTVTDEVIQAEWDASSHRYSPDSGATVRPSSGSYVGSPTNGTVGDVTYRAYSSPPDVVPNAAGGDRYSFFAQTTSGQSIRLMGPVAPSLDQNPPDAPNLSGTPAGPRDINWSWVAPARLCGPPTAVPNYTLLDPVPPSSNFAVGNVLAFAESFPLETPNVKHVKHVRVTDNWGTSALSSGVTVYTLAAPASAITFSAVSDSGLTVNWNPAGNPAYTRWDVAFWDNATPSAVSTIAFISQNHTATSISVSGLLAGTQYTFRVRPANGRVEDNFGGVLSAPLTATTFTRASRPALRGAALPGNIIRWSWDALPGTDEWRLYEAGTSILMPGAALPPATLSFDSGTVGPALLPNRPYSAELESFNNTSLLASVRGGPLTVFTQAEPPTVGGPGTGVVGVSTHSASYAWSGGNNPNFTFYEVIVSTDALFAAVAATKTIGNAAITVAGLFPGTTYYARVRALNGDSQPTGWAVLGGTVTNRNQAVSVATGPANAYTNPAGIVGLWHLEGSGVAAGDSSGFSNDAALSCATNGCTSTPTYTTGPPGLGKGLQFTGQPGSMLRAPPAAQYDFTGSITVMAWVKPASLAMPNGAAIIAKGPGAAESFSLDLSAGRWRFLARAGFATASATSSARVDAWDHVAGTYDAATGLISIYVNGVFSNSVNVGAGARTLNAGAPITAGTRQSGVNAFDLGFNGAIDELRVINALYDAAAIREQYLDSLSKEFALPPPNQNFRLSLAPDAFQAPVVLYASNDPRTSPIRASAIALAGALASPPTGQLQLLANGLIEIVPTVGGVPFTGNLGSSATLSFPYSDGNGDGILDGTNPPVSANSLKVFTLDESVVRWVELPSSVDFGNRRVVARTPHFSVFGLFGGTTIASTLSRLRIYPNPWQIGVGGRYDAPLLTFDRLPSSGLIRIFTLSGERVHQLEFTGNNAGALTWNGRNFNGEPIASGVYFAFVKGDDGSTAILKFGVER